MICNTQTVKISKPSFKEKKLKKEILAFYGFSSGSPLFAR
jgi:hypothetical protein